MNAAELRAEAEAEDRRDHARKGHHYERPIDASGCGFEAAVGFDFAEVDRRLAGEPEERDLKPTPTEFAVAAEMLGGLLRYLAESSTPQSAGLRAWALVWSVRPDLMQGRWRSVAECCREFGLKRQSISKYSGLLARMAPRYTHGTGHKSQAERELHRLRATEQHRGKGHRLNPRKSQIERIVKKVLEAMHQNRKDFTDSRLIEKGENP